MSQSLVTLSVGGGIANIEIDNPLRRNAITLEVARQLIDACDEIDATSAVGVAILSGAGGSFCSGADRDLLASIGRDPLGPGYADLDLVYRAFTRVGQLLVPTIAAVRGAAVGAGLNLMLATDLRIVAHDARLLSGFLRIGLHPGGGHFGLLGRTGGREAAAAMGIFGQEIGAARAVELGLAWCAVDPDDLMTTARALADPLATDPDLARLAVASLRTELGAQAMPWPAAQGVERGPQMWSMARR